MKKVLFLFGIIATLLTSCEVSNDTVKNATIKVTSKSEITVAGGNAQGIITYELLSPIEGATVEASANVTWINSFDFSQMGKIGYKVISTPATIIFIMFLLKLFYVIILLYHKTLKLSSGFV